MGLLDILNTLGGTSGDPRARPAPNQGTGQATSQGMSPMAKALLALLAIYAMKNMRRADSAPSQPAGRPGDVNAGLPGGGSSGGGLGDLLKQFQQSGHGDVAHSWIGTGPNKQISEGELASALGTDTLDTLSKQTGMGREDLLSGLSQHLPRFVDQLTPDGRLPNDDEAQRMV